MVVLESLYCVVIDSTGTNLFFDRAINALRCPLDDPCVLGRAIDRYWYNIDDTCIGVYV